MISYICFLSFLTPIAISALSLELLFQEEIRNGELELNPSITHHRQKRHTAASTMTSEIQETLLEAHNQARSEVSPPAANMKTMMWDADLSNSAQEWADQCSYNHSSDGSVGQIITYEVLNGSLDTFDFASLILNNESRADYTYSDTNCSSGSVCGDCGENDECLFYTQIIWADTEYVGCGVNYNCGGEPFGLSDVNDTVYLVCDYKPPGNEYGLPPYQQGEPCSNCSIEYSACINNLCTRETSCMPPIPNVPDSSVLINEGNLPGNKIVFSCNDGFKMNEDYMANVTCGDDGQWSELPNCTAEAIYCLPRVPMVDNARVVINEGNQPGDQIVFSCDDGYTMFDSCIANITCEDDGQWSDLPNCTDEDIRCLPPIPKVMGASVVENWGNEVGSVIIYACDAGYSMNDSSLANVTCEDDGYWSELPMCVQDEEIRCYPPVPEVMGASIVENYGNEYGDMILYSCDAGYMIDNSTIANVTCGDDGQWSDFPICLADQDIRCSPDVPMVMGASIVDKTGNEFGDMILYSCDVGYMMNDSSLANVTCEEDGHWSELPLCTADERMRCLPDIPSVMGASVIENTGNEYGDMILYSCDAGYMMNDSSLANVTCGDDGEWSELPMCTSEKEIRCSPPIPRVMGATIVEYMGNEYGDMIFYTCDAGYMMYDPSLANVTCGDDGEWSKLPMCTAQKGMRCLPDIPSVMGASVIENTGNEYGDMILYSCDAGYMMNDSSLANVTCGDDGEWSELPMCTSEKEIRCSPPIPSVMGATIVENMGNEYGDMIFYTCDAGYMMYDPSLANVTCGDDGEWSKLPMCVPQKEIRCSPPIPSVMGATIVENMGNEYGDMIFYTCDAGYMMYDPSLANVTCGDDGEWSKLPMCVPQKGMPCLPDIPRVMGASVVEKTGNEYGDMILYSCDAGYMMKDSSLANVTCGDEGQWSELPMCTPEKDMRCSPAIPKVMGASIVENTGNGYGDMIMYICNAGYMMNDTSLANVTCGDDGQWSELPICDPDEQNRCLPASPEVMGANIVEYTGNGYGDMIMYSCGAGYMMNDSSLANVTCGDDGQWSQLPMCSPEEWCSPLEPEVMGATITETTGSGNRKTLTYSCDDGYTMENLSLAIVICGEDRQWSEFPTCVRDEEWCSPSEPEVMGATIVETTVSGNRKIITFSCDDGYTMEDSSMANVTCGEDRQWSELPTCVRDEEWCSQTEPEVMMASIVETMLIGNRKVLTYSCDDRYTMEDPSLANVTCGEDRQWSELPTCVLDEEWCSPSEPEVMGATIVKTTVSGTEKTITYACDDGYTMENASFADVTCGEDRQWSQLPTCVADEVWCSPSVPEVTGATIVETTVDGNQKTITYSCDDGYIMEDPSLANVTCGEDRQWSELPECEVICTPEPSVSNADVVGEGNRINDTRTFTCKEGYDLSGSSTVKCQEGGTWSTLPVCIEPISCGIEPTVTNANVEGTGNSVGDTRTFTCQSGYTMAGDAEVTCEEDGLWSSLPICSPVTCSPEPSVANADVEGEGNSFGDTRTFTCQSGYIINGDDEVTCVENGEWSTLPTCDAVTCSPEPFVENADVEGEGINVGDTRTFTCQSGYDLSGTGTVTCQDGGTWSTLPSCTESVSCEAEPTVANADVVVSGTSVGDTSTFTCQSGYTLTGDSVVTCQEDGFWSPLPTCTPVTCSPEPSVANADVEGEGNTYGDTRTFTCQSGYTLTGDAEVTCEENGEWSSLPTCDAVTCFPEPSVANADVEGEGNSFGDTRTFTCQSGFTINGDAEVTCEENGQWSNLPTCDAVTCSPEPSVENADVEGEGNNVGDTRTFTCQSGYDLSGTSTVTCQDDGMWSTSPTCVESTSCGTEPTVTNADVEGTGNSVGDTRTFTCQSGYILTGDAEVTCEEDGFWSSLPTCTPVTCPDPPTTVENGAVSGSGDSFGDTRTITCNSGYAISGASAVVTCQADTTWSTTPSCFYDDPFTCTFEVDFCDFTQLTDDDFDWWLETGDTPSDNTGPSSAAEGSQYTYIEATNIAEGETATLETNYQFAGGDRCISFDLHMEGYFFQMGTFQVLTGTGDDFEVVFERIGFVSSDWVDIEITENIEGKKVRLTAIRGPGFQSDIAIDDFQINQGAC